MKRAQIVKTCEPLVISETDIPKPPEYGMVIKTVFAGVCHSDVHQWEDKIDLGFQELRFTSFPIYKLPAVPGHEISGLVYSIGPKQDQDEFEVGDHVVIYPWRGCGSCGYCDDNRSSLCDKRLYFGFDIPGGYASFVVVPDSKFVVKLPPNIPLDLACMLPCSGLTAYNAARNAQPSIDLANKFEGRSALLIIGAGGLGLWCLQISKALFPDSTKIVVADITEQKLSVAKQWGCDETMLWSPDLDEESLIQKTSAKGFKNGFNAIIDFVNMPVTSQRAFHCLRQNGTHVLVGLYGGAVSLSLPQVVLTSRVIRGVYVGEIRQLKELIQLVTNKKVIPPPLRYFELDDVTMALTMMKEGRMEGRGIIKFQQHSNIQIIPKL